MYLNNDSMQGEKLERIRKLSFEVNISGLKQTKRLHGVNINLRNQ